MRNSFLVSSAPPVVVILVLIALVCAPDSFASDREKKAQILLDGVRDSRLSLRAGKILMHEVRTLHSRDETQQFRTEIEWKDSRVRLTETEASRSGRRCAIRNGNDLFYLFNGDAGLTDATGEYASFVFDPRLLGAYPVLTGLSDAERSLFPQSSKWRAEVLRPMEDCNGHECSVVALTVPGGRREYWIEDTVGFPVRKLVDHNNALTIEADYHPDASLPFKLTETRRSADGALQHTKHCTVEWLSSDPPDDERFTISGLDLDIGQPFADQRQAQVVGYWNGTGLSVSRQLAFVELSSAGVERNSDVSRARMFLIGFLPVVVVLIFLMQRVRRRG